jgi:hypothetical protein
LRRCLDRLSYAVDLVGAQVVHEDDVALAQRRHEHLLDIGEERWPIERAVDDIWRGEAVAAKRRDHRQRLPVSVRNLGDQSLAEGSAPIAAHHLGRHCRLVEEHQSRRFEGRLLRLQCSTCRSNVRTILLGGVQSFF